jgi:Txe/YoeB family toxin of toxin-antitoxin system
MVSEPWAIAWTPKALKDRKKLAASPYRDKGRQLVALLREDPNRTPPPFEQLIGDLSGACSRRINIQHRLVYQVLEEEHTVKILSCWTHYEK